MASVQYYQLVRAMRLLVFAHRSATTVHRSANAPIRQCWTATEVIHFTKHILAAAMGLMAMPDPNYIVELNTSVENAA